MVIAAESVYLLALYSTVLATLTHFHYWSAIAHYSQEHKYRELKEMWGCHCWWVSLSFLILKFFSCLLLLPATAEPLLIYPASNIPADGQWAMEVIWVCSTTSYTTNTPQSYSHCWQYPTSHSAHSTVNWEGFLTSTISFKRSNFQGGISQASIPLVSKLTIWISSSADSVVIVDL